ncbi:uncharacterized protein METZ01_LOCUS237372, partial [marine metagenome]
VHDGILLSVTYQRILLLTIGEPLCIVLDTAWEAVEPGRTDFPVFANHDAADLGRWVLAPSRDVLGELEKTSVPLLAHVVTSGLASGRVVIAVCLGAVRVVS